MGTIPDDTGIKYYAEAFNGEVYTLLDGINIPLNTATDRIKIGGILRTDNRTKTPEIYRLKLTTIGERPLSNQLDSLQDINTSISNTLSLSSDRAVGQKSILIDHTNTGRGEYIINGESFDVSKLPVISIWVKPLTDYPVSFSIFNPATGRDELIKSDQDGNGYFEIGEDLYENQWNLLLLDLRKAGSNLRGVRDFKVIINEYGTKVLIDGVDSLPLNQTQYIYDRVGNRKEVITNGISMKYYYQSGTNLLERRESSRERVITVMIMRVI